MLLTGLRFWIACGSLETMLKKIALGVGLVVAAVVVGVLALVSRQPDSFHVDRTKMISAPPEVVFAQVNDLRAWSSWSPWEKLDPDQSKTFSGPDTGTGSSLEWSGNDQVGRGRMTIVESVPPERVEIKLEFIEPFESESATAFDLEPVGDHQTRVTWSMDGDVDLMMKVFGLFMSFEDAIGADYEKGLSNLNRVAIRAWKTERARADEARAETTHDSDPESPSEPDESSESAPD